MAIQAALEEAIHVFAPNAQINIEPVNGRLAGLVIAPEFNDMTHVDRQTATWRGIRDHMGADSQQIGTLLLYTPDEAGAVEDNPDDEE